MHELVPCMQNTMHADLIHSTRTIFCFWEATTSKHTIIAEKGLIELSIVVFSTLFSSQE